jgi:hypothetical protein
MEKELEFGKVIRELAAEAKVVGAEVERIGEPPHPLSSRRYRKASTGCSAS